MIKTELNSDLVLSLYEKYLPDLKSVRAYEKKMLSRAYDYRFGQYRPYRIARDLMKRLGVEQLGARLYPRFDDIEAEITYLLIREFRPGTVVEISPADGWSTSWILNALKDNGTGRLWSFDVVDNSTRNIPPHLSGNRWTFFQGDIRENTDKLPEKIDYLFIDSDHSAEFARWYIGHLFPRIAAGTPVSVHDVFQSAEWHFPEKEVILDWLKGRGIGRFSASSVDERKVFEEIDRCKKRLNIAGPIHRSTINPAIFFISR